ncbi:unnamed protein product [Angiostrongylus costaricensis]|uniref:Uncharacterized protein n=1 Tax=Angiostrongylus costaricensis TaxID=334426 RepID=A0A0R3PH45_ANGCS|nr:unnamed protein product [Angiostrongylus costaricensis]
MKKFKSFSKICTRNLNYNIYLYVYVEMILVKL